MHLDLRLTLLVTSIQLISALLIRVIQLSMVRLALVLMGVMWCPPSSSKVLASWPGPVLRWIELPERRRWWMVWIWVVAIRWRGRMIRRVRITWLWRGEPASSPTLPLLRGESRSAPSSSSPSHGILHHLREGLLLLISPVQTREAQSTWRSIPPICLLHRVAIGRPSKLLDSHRSFLTQTRFSNTSSLF